MTSTSNFRLVLKLPSLSDVDVWIEEVESIGDHPVTFTMDTVIELRNRTVMLSIKDKL